MLDIKRIRKDPELVKTQLAKRHGDFGIDDVLALDDREEIYL